MVRVYRYGLLAPTENAELVREQMRLAHRYRNTLTEIERGRRAALRQVLTEMGDLHQFEAAFTAAKATEDQARKCLKAARAKSRGKAPDELAQAVREAKEQRKEAGKALREGRRAARENTQLQAATDAIAERANELQRSAREHCGVFWGCVDEETEILTRDGWKTQEMFTGTEVVATYNLETMRLEWQVATGKTVAPYEGLMAHVKNARLDMLLTPNHRVVMQRLTKGGEFLTEVRRAEETSGNNSRWRIPQAADGLEPSDPLDVSPDMASVLGWVLAEGSFVKGSSGVIVDQSHRVNEQYCAEIRDALTGAGIMFNERPNDDDGMTRFYIKAESGRQIREMIPDKLLTPALALNLRRESAQALLDALLRGDGTLGETSTGKPRWRWIQKSRVNMDLFQALALRLGISSAVSWARGDIGVASVRLQPYATWQCHFGEILRWIQFRGIVWCPSTPNTTWVARRMGKIFVTGNSYLIVEDAMQAAAKAPLYDGTEPNDPRFVRWTGDGAVSVQIQAHAGDEPFGIVQATAGDDRRLQIRTGLPAIRCAKKSSALKAAPLGAPLTGRRAGHRADLRLRISSDGREPIWATWPMIMHRPIPDEARIKRATVHVRKRGPREEWSVEITVDGVQPRPRTPTGGVVGVDLGWRVIGDELRVAKWSDDSDGEGELRLDAKTISGLRKPESLQSTRDQNFDDARAQLNTWLHDSSDKLPGWLKDKTTHLGQWRSEARLAGLCRQWKGQRFEGDAGAYDALEAWRYHDFHLWAWEEGQRTGALRHRREVYRRFAAELARKYETLVLEDFDLRDMARRPTTEEQETTNEQARSNRHLAATSELRLCLIHAFAARGGRWTKEPPENTTRECNECHHINVFDAAANITHACFNCGVVWDQDENAAVNLLQRRRERLRGEQEAGGARKDEKTKKDDAKDESRWQRARRLAEEKAARLGGARETPDNGAE
jgi:transposase